MTIQISSAAPTAANRPAAFIATTLSPDAAGRPFHSERLYTAIFSKQENTQ